jgi:hypothetical protein
LVIDGDINNCQLLILLTLKEYLAEDCQDTIELIEIMDSLKEKIQLNEVLYFMKPQIENLRQLHQTVQVDPEILSQNKIDHKRYPQKNPAGW